MTIAARPELLGLALLVLPELAVAQEPSFMPPGQLEPRTGTGLHDSTIYYPGIRFTTEIAPAFANSQNYRPGGQGGGPGGQCSRVNYSYPWWDNFCETRGRDTPLCPTGRGHQGQDIRPATCKADLHWAVAVAAGWIAHVGSYSFTLQTPNGTLHNYLHVNLSTLTVKRGDRVTRGQRLATISNWFGGTPTTIHLHFEIKDAASVAGRRRVVHIPPYATLVASYKRLLDGTP